MVYMGNIINEFNKLSDDYEICLRFKSGAVSFVKASDKIEKKNGDLKFDRFHKGEYLCTVYVDCCEVESMSIIQAKEY